MTAGGEDRSRRPLGRGLSALFGDAESPSAPTAALRQMPIAMLKPGRFQPRRVFDADEMAALVESVKQRGVLQPILVRRDNGKPDSFEIIAGERRWRAAQSAGLHEIPVVVREVSDREALEVALVENVQRENLGPLEEAEGYRRLTAEFGHAQEELARAVGKSRSHVANTMRLLRLPQPVKQMLEDGQISAGHARVMLSAADPMAIARKVVDEGLNVRQTEALVLGRASAKKAPEAASKPAAAAKDVDTLALERDLSKALGFAVTIEPAGAGGSGRVVVRYKTLVQLDDILKRLKNEPVVGPGARRAGSL